MFSVRLHRQLKTFSVHKSVSGILLLGLTFTTSAAQISQEEHLSHHPEQAQATPNSQGSATRGGGGTGGGDMGGMMGGGMGGMMDGMMEKMGASKLKELYPRLMELPNLPMEERAKIEAEAHERMTAGAALLPDGLDALTNSAATDDFSSMQVATAQMREGLSQFESGLAAHRSIAEGKAPRNVALQWFKREMNLLPAVAITQPRFFGMTPFHTTVMAVLVIFAVVMLWMYYFKMRRASLLLESLTADGSEKSEKTPTAANVATSPLAQLAAKSATTRLAANSVSQTPPRESAPCCDEEDADCATTCEDTSEQLSASEGLLPVAKRTLCKLRVARIFQ